MRRKKRAESFDPMTGAVAQSDKFSGEVMHCCLCAGQRVSDLIQYVVRFHADAVREAFATLAAEAVIGCATEI